MALTESTAHADGRVGRRIENYTAFWQKDISKEASEDTGNRLENYTDVVNGASVIATVNVMSWRSTRGP